MSAPINLLTPLWRLCLARRLRRGCGHELPRWVLAEVSLDAAQAAWLLRTVCS